MAPITVETAAAGMLRSRHEQYRELGINLIDKCTGKTWLLARLLSFSASTPVKFLARGWPRGPQGPKGDPVSITGWEIDAASYTATPILSDGQKGSPLQLRDLFKQFIVDAR
jgi:hypothetical protein